VEYTGEPCECGRPLFARVVTLGVGVESRRGPSCWFDDCSVHRSFEEAAASRVAARNALVGVGR